MTARQYALGFSLDVLGSALHGLIFALSELVFARVLGRRSFHVVLEQQAAVSLCAFAFTSAGLAAAEGFQAMRREAARFARGGEAAYANVMVWTAGHVPARRARRHRRAVPGVDRPRRRSERREGAPDERRRGDLVP